MVVETQKAQAPMAGCKIAKVKLFRAIGAVRDRQNEARDAGNYAGLRSLMEQEALWVKLDEVRRAVPDPPFSEVKSLKQYHHPRG